MTFRNNVSCRGGLVWLGPWVSWACGTSLGRLRAESREWSRGLAREGCHNHAAMSFRFAYFCSNSLRPLPIRNSAMLSDTREAAVAR